jgi:TonB-linked SusC/RagA family outer membrane protein
MKGFNVFKKVRFFKKSKGVGVIALAAIILFAGLQANAQTKTVSGVVQDNFGPVVGASVIEVGTLNGVVTDMDGKFTLNNVASTGSIQVSYIGYLPQTFAVANQTVFTVNLVEDSQNLDEVVVVGYGTQRKEAVTGSVASVKGEIMREVPSANISQALQGRVSGVEMSQTSSKPGSEMQIRIRGTRSLNASNDPLVVLDGIPFAGSIGDINPSDIKSIDILKDASATAIYGSRGANGVLLVTTHKGTAGATATVSYNGYFGAKSAIKYPMMDGPTFQALRAAAGRFSNGPDEVDGTNTDWQDLLYQTGTVQSHDVAVSGGMAKGSYNFGVGYYFDEAVIPTQNYRRLSLRAGFDQELGDYFRFGGTTNSNYNVLQGQQLGMYGTLNSSPLASPYDDQGNLRNTIAMANDVQWVYTKDRIEDLSDQWLNDTKNFGSYNTVYASVKCPGVPELKYQVNVGLNFRTSAGGAYTGQGINSATATSESTASITNSLRTNWAVENLLTYDKVFGDKHSVNAVALYSAEQTSYNLSKVTARNIPADHFQYFNLGQALGEIQVPVDDQIYQVSGLMSYMGRVMYSYDTKYMISATVRADGSSRLAPGHQWHTYPAVSLGWNPKREQFMEDVKWLDNLKIRAGYGETSNQAVDPYQTLGKLSTRPYNYGTTNVTGTYVTNLPSPTLGWEYSTTWNFGIDFAVLNNRLSGTIEYYTTDTKDLLMSVNLPSTAGVSTYMGNIGSTNNKGFEISLNGTILEKDGWTWDVGFNLYANQNELVSLASGQLEDKDNWWFVGKPINVIYDYEKIGLWQENEEALREIMEPGGNAGMIKVKGGYDENGNARQITADDRQVIELDPDFQGGFNTRVAYKGFDLSIIGAYKSGGTLVSTLYSSTGYLNMLSGRRGQVDVDYWTPTNTDADFPKPGGIESSDNPKYGKSLGYFDASYLKIRTISLGYDFNKKLLTHTGISKLRAYVSIQNPFVFFSPYHTLSGGDPETNSTGDENAAVTTDYPSRILTVGTNSPATKNFIFGLNLTF